MFGCAKHTGVISSGSCGQCGLEYCEDCLVFPFGTNKPPMCVGCALAFAGVRHKGAAKPRVPKQRVSWSERRRRKNRPTVPTVTVPTPSLEDEFDLGDFDTIAEEPCLSQPTEPSLNEAFIPLEAKVPSIAGPTTLQGLEALIAVPLPKRQVAIQP
jgi:hypothetical protein